MFPSGDCFNLYPMKILIQNSLFFPNIIGGAEISSHLLGMELRRRGIAADGVASTGHCDGGKSISNRPTADGLGLVYEASSHGYCDLLPTENSTGQNSFIMRSLNHFASVHSRRWQGIFTSILERSKPDILHTNTIVGLTPSIWEAARRKGIPIVHTLRDYHLLCPRTTLLRSDNTDCQNPPVPCRILARLKLDQTKDIQVATGPTNFVLQKHLDAGGFPAAEPHVVANALEEWPEEIPQRKAADPVRGLFLGQLNIHKGIPVLLEVLAELFNDSKCNDLIFDFAGTGPLVADVEEFCAAHPGRAHYHGVVKDDAKRNLLAQASFMVVPSVWAEPFSRSIIDGFSWGLPAIGSNQGGIPEVINNGLDGQVVQPTFEHLTAAIRKYTLEPEFRLEQGKAARKHASDFTLAHQVDRFQAIYESLLMKKGGKS